MDSNLHRELDEGQTRSNLNTERYQRECFEKRHPFKRQHRLVENITRGPEV